MRIIIIAREDLFFIPTYILPLIKKYKKNLIIVAIVGLPPYITIKYFIKLLIKYGFLNFILKMGQYLIFNIWSFLGVGEPTKFYSVRRLARYYGAEYKEMIDVHCSKFINFVNTIKPDVILSVMSPVIFKPELLNRVSLAINIHPSILPQYKGIDPLFWAIKNSEKYAGISIHKMRKEVDSGEILMQTRFKLGKNISLYGANLKASQLGGKLLLKLLSKSLKSIQKIESKKNNDKIPVFYTPKIKDIHDYLRKKKRLLYLKECFPFINS